MDHIKKITNYFSKREIALWMLSVLLMTVSFALFDRENYLTLIASVVGVTSLIFIAKGNPVGQILMIAFSSFYGVISFAFAYYGEVITYLGMTLPMAAVSLGSWLRHPYKGNRAQVEVNKLKPKEPYFIAVLTLMVTVVGYFVLKLFGTANLIPSTVSVATSFVAAYLTFRRSPFFALVYAINDIVLIVLWTLAAFTDVSYISVVVCFGAFLMNDLYGFFNWRKMQTRQHLSNAE